MEDKEDLEETGETAFDESEMKSAKEWRQSKVGVDAAKVMEEFKSYASIPRHDHKRFTEKLLSYPLVKEIEWCAVEKVHGANFMVLTDGKVVKFGKRNSFLEESSKFNGFQKLVPDLTAKMLNLFKFVTSGEFKVKDGLDFTKANAIVVNAEIFGGSYDHKDVKKVAGASCVQKGVFYSPNVHVVCYDLRVGECWVSYKDAMVAFKAAELLYQEPVKVGTLDDLLAFDVEKFESKVPEIFKLPLIPKNIAEGVVIRPYEHGWHVLVKKKANAFEEKASAPTKSDKPAKEKKDKPDEKDPVLASLKDEFSKYFNENRLKSVLSKEEDVTTIEQMKKLIPKLRQDALDDFKKDFADKLKAVDASVAKAVYGEAGKLATDVIATYGGGLLKPGDGKSGKGGGKGGKKKKSPKGGVDDDIPDEDADLL